jgi:dTDP-4-dehydrorhamnose reductase
MPRRDTVLITGSGGMLGTALTEELKDHHDIYGLDSRPGGAGLSGFVKADITDGRAIIAAFNDISPQFVIHAAAWTDVDGCEADPAKAETINSRGTANVAGACKACGAVMVYISTDFVFDGMKKKPYTEKDTPGPLSVYAKSKLGGEEAVRKALGQYYIIRTSWLYGKHGENFVDTVIAMASGTGVLKVVDDQTGSPTYSDDLAEAIRILMDRKPAYGIYNVSNSGSVSWYEYARRIVEITGLRAEVTPISSQELARPARRPAMSVLDNSKFAGATGHLMRPWQEALYGYLKERQRIKC